MLDLYNWLSRRALLTRILNKYHGRLSRSCQLLRLGKLDIRL